MMLSQPRRDMSRAFVRILSALSMSLSGILFFVIQIPYLGYVLVLLSLLLSFISDKRLFRDLTLIAIALIIMSLVPINTEISITHMLVMGTAMAAIVGIPYVISRYMYKDHSVTFPWHFTEKWTTIKWIYLGLVAVVGYLLLPFYMISTGAYLNWPAANEADEVLRLFAGTNALGIWDELFFICTVFVLLRRHFSFWVANILQAILFASFLYELGFESWGLPMTFIFAMVQGYIFKVTHSLFYIVCIHLLFDLFLFLVLLHAHNRDILNIFFY